MSPKLADAEPRMPVRCVIYVGGTSGAPSATPWDTTCDKVTATTAGGIGS
jgi:hypothetical protein